MPTSCRVRQKTDFVVCALLASALPALVAQGSSVVQLSLPQLADHSATVIEGTVAELRPRWAGSPREIETEVVLKDVSFWKGGGSHTIDTFSFVVPGGTLDGFSAAVCCAPEFRVGERWICFLLPEYHTFPTVGLFQGAFLVTEDEEGQTRISRRRHGAVDPISGIDEAGRFISAAPPAADVHAKLVRAEGIRVNTPAAAPRADAMTYADFKALAQPVLAASKIHPQAGKAPVHIRTQPVATKLRPATPGDVPETKTRRPSDVPVISGDETLPVEETAEGDE